MIPLQRRRWIARAVKLALVGLAGGVVLAWMTEKRSSHRDESVRIHTGRRGGARVATAPAVDALAPGDVRIFNQDSSVNLILRGDQVLAGLSPQMREKIQREITQSTASETSGFGAAVANVVRTTVASAIGTHAAYPLRDIRDIEYDDGEIVIVQRNGRRVELLGDVKSDDQEISRTFSADDAQQFVEAVRARLRELRARR